MIYLKIGKKTQGRTYVFLPIFKFFVN